MGAPIRSDRDRRRRSAAFASARMIVRPAHGARRFGVLRPSSDAKAARFDRSQRVARPESRDSKRSGPGIWEKLRNLPAMETFITICFVC
jgi:hypothetical protein